jgi:hypothetical protein
VATGGVGGIIGSPPQPASNATNSTKMKVEYILEARIDFHHPVAKELTGRQRQAVMAVMVSG